MAIGVTMGRRRLLKVGGGEVGSTTALLLLCVALGWNRAAGRPMATTVPEVDWTAAGDRSVHKLTATTRDAAMFKLNEGASIMAVTKEVFVGACPRSLPLTVARDVVRLAYERAQFIDMIDNEEGTRALIDPESHADSWADGLRPAVSKAVAETVQGAQLRLVKLRDSEVSLETKLKVDPPSDVGVDLSIKPDPTVPFPLEMGEILKVVAGQAHETTLRSLKGGVAHWEARWDAEEPETDLFLMSTECHRAKVTVIEPPAATCPTDAAAVGAAAAAAALLSPPTPLERIVMTFAGSGPVDTAIDSHDGEERIRPHVEKMHPDGVVAATTVELSYPAGILFVPATAAIYLCNSGSDHISGEYSNDWLAKMDAANHIEHVTGGFQGYSDGSKEEAMFGQLGGLALNKKTGEVFIADVGNDMIRVIAPDGIVKTVSGLQVTSGSRQEFNSKIGSHADGDSNTSLFDNPNGMAFDDASQILYVADTDNNRIRAVIGGTEQTTTVAGRNHQGEHNGAGLAATFRYPTGLALDPTRRILYVADNGNHLIRYIELGPAVEHVAPESVVVKTLAGVGMHGGCDGGPEVAAFNSPGGLWHDPVQNVLYVSDSHRIRAVGAVGHPRQGTVATVAGTSKPGYTDGAGSVAQFASPGHLSGDAEKRVLYIADSLNHRVRRLSLDGFKGDPTTHSEL